MTEDLSWLYSPAVFQVPERIGASGWLEHTPFAFWLIDKLRPERLVELGTHTGISFCAFNQAIKQLGTATACHAVDTWQGDQHAGYYGDNIYNELARYNEDRYGSFATLIRARFDEALAHFDDGAIDLLHIDGLHTYEAVAHDHKTWLPKVKEGGVILFHDTNVRRGDFGVHRYWAEIAEGAHAFEFLHGFGLGVLVKGEPRNEAMAALCAARHDPEATSAVRRTFGFLGGAVTNRLKLAMAAKKAPAQARQA
ncbi:class I SAM-dependent methyltransferase [Afifella aestuarii]|uniref:class I SAM-dependent methyltransferase n=1 Tax=Afifella aestuarii TaxID=1909496 RepID=UPI000FE2D74E|nr:class I SAM-dependent methyltransferase [Afifella aestuarii]